MAAILAIILIALVVIIFIVFLSRSTACSKDKQEKDVQDERQMMSYPNRPPYYPGSMYARPHPFFGGSYPRPYNWPTYATPLGGSIGNVQVGMPTPEEMRNNGGLIKFKITKSGNYDTLILSVYSYKTGTYNPYAEMQFDSYRIVIGFGGLLNVVRRGNSGGPNKVFWTFENPHRYAYEYQHSDGSPLYSSVDGFGYSPTSFEYEGHYDQDNFMTVRVPLENLKDELYIGEAVGQEVYFVPSASRIRDLSILHTFYFLDIDGEVNVYDTSDNRVSRYNGHRTFEYSNGMLMSYSTSTSQGQTQAGHNQVTINMKPQYTQYIPYQKYMPSYPFVPRPFVYDPALGYDRSAIVENNYQLIMRDGTTTEGNVQYKPNQNDSAQVSSSNAGLSQIWVPWTQGDQFLHINFYSRILPNLA